MFQQRIIPGVLLALLVFSILAGTAEQLHSRTLALGAWLWKDYLTLRQDPAPPTCDPQFDLNTRLDTLQREFEANQDPDDLFPETFDRAATATSLENRRVICQQEHDAFALRETQLDGWVRAYRLLDQSLSQFSLFAINQQHRILMLTLLLAALYCTAKGEHIAFRGILSRLDHRVSFTGQLLANLSLSFSSVAFLSGGQAAGVEVQHTDNVLLLAIGSLLMAALNVWQLARPPASLERKGQLGKALLAVPIYSFMLLGAAFHFMVKENYTAGIAVYFTQLLQMSGLYLNIALFIWVGMLLKQSQLGAKLFAVFVPMRLPPELLGLLAVALMALPTAYTGASGIIIIAMGATVYQELRRVGTRRQLALAVTAMTGSMGVVLRPCLLIVGIAMLNKEVVTDELFHWGSRVFALSLVVFSLWAMIVRRKDNELIEVTVGTGDTTARLTTLLPYLLLTVGIALLYAQGLNAHLDEFSAPFILPVIVLAFLWFEKRTRLGQAQRPAELTDLSRPLRPALGHSIQDASIQIGALLMVMGCSFTVGGILEQQSGAALSTTLFSSPLMAMVCLLLALIVIGMLMDPFGALILVSGTLAPMAYANGIHPVHFWMTCLVAFELGYLTPPVALNHLLTRQVVGTAEFELSRSVKGSFYYRHERILLPLLVMGTTLLIVAFAPLWATH
ncbi:MAG: TRAP transporter large permease subunit [Hahellaceae bacterium]|nr:TRAP transporter large permease subunit [Hahellaceae bacterium]